uniref:SOUL heme-binding protein n=1 Tax=Kalanchoe fedtschenkoi TaxID=63787 RepID=A0A7N0UJ31_KALFE
MGNTMGVVFGKIVVETTKYEVVRKAFEYEIRRYAPSVIAQVTYAPSEFKGDKDSGFGVLVDYIGFLRTPKNTKPEKIAMTTPVVTAASGEKVAMTTPVVTKAGAGEKIAMTTPVITDEKNDLVTMQFVLPDKYKKAAEAPTPTDPRVVILEEGEKDYGVVTFSGAATDSVVAEKARKLRGWLERDGVKVVGDYSLARYNPPWITLPAFRTNEVKYPVELN